MNSNEMQNIWNSPFNNMSPRHQEQLAGQFIRQVIRRRRFQSIWLINTFAWLTIITVIAGWNLTRGNVQPLQEWGLVPLLIVPWAFAVYFLRRYLQSAAPTSQGELPVVESLRAALVSNLSHQSRLKIVGVLYVVMIPMIALTMRQLQAVGKVSGHELASMAVLFGGALFISAAVMAALFFGRLLPQQKRLENLLAEVANESPK
jgi:hypothetical protein